tara:strand:+ start:2177 stop:2425 length:249 start_codon:yes stop_codon:yes gene_type:complete
MPTYSYKCDACDHEFSEIHRISEMNKPTKEPCPECGKEGNIRTKITGSKFSFKKEFKPDDGFREVISKIKQNHPKHNIKKEY